MANESDSPLGLFFDQSNKVLLVHFSAPWLHGTHRAGVGDDTDVVPARSAACHRLSLENSTFGPLDLA